MIFIDFGHVSAEAARMRPSSFVHLNVQRLSLRISASRFVVRLSFPRLVRFPFAREAYEAAWHRYTLRVARIDV